MRLQCIKARDLLFHIPKESLHIHTDYTDGECSVKSVVEQAESMGFERIAITEHIDKNSDWFEKFSQEVEILRMNKKSIKIIYGIEPRAIDYDGNLNAPQGIIDNSEIVIGVVHSYPKEERSFETEKYGMHEITAEKALYLEYNASLALIKNGIIDVLGHPGGTYFKHFGKPPYDFYKDIIKEVSQSEVAIEINPFYLENVKEILEICMEFNPYIVLGDNAHKLNHLGKAYEAVREAINEL